MGLSVCKNAAAASENLTESRRRQEGTASRGLQPRPKGN